MEPPAADDAQAWLVYADWLQGRPEPDERALGELIVLGDAPDAHRSARIDALVTEYREAWLGGPEPLRGLDLDDWRSGLPRELRVKLSGAGAAQELITAFGHRMTARVERVTMTSCDEDGDCTIAEFFAWFATARQRLRSLVVDTTPSFGGPYRSYAMTLGEVGSVWRSPLERLQLDSSVGLTIGRVDAPHLTDLDLGVIGTESMASLADAALPRLARLHLHVGPGRYDPPADWTDAVAYLPAIVDHAPALRTLALASRYAVVGQLLDVLAQMSLAQLDELDLRGVRMTDDNIAALRRCRDACAQIPRVRISAHYVRDKRSIPRLGRTCEVV